MGASHLYAMVLTSYALASLFVLTNPDPGAPEYSAPAVASTSNKIICYGQIAFTAIATLIAQKEKDIQRHCRNVALFVGGLSFLTLIFIGQAGPLHVRFVSTLGVIAWIIDVFKMQPFTKISIAPNNVFPPSALIKRRDATAWLPYTWIPSEYACTYLLSMLPCLFTHYLSMKDQVVAGRAAQTFLPIRRVQIMLTGLIYLFVVFDYLLRLLFLTLSFIVSERGQNARLMTPANWIWDSFRKFDPGLTGYNTHLIQESSCQLISDRAFDDPQESANENPKSFFPKDNNISSNPERSIGKTPQQRIKQLVLFIRTIHSKVGIGFLMIIVLVAKLEMELQLNIDQTQVEPFASLRDTVMASVSLQTSLIGTLEQAKAWQRTPEAHHLILSYSLIQHIQNGFPGTHPVVPFLLRLKRVMLHPGHTYDTILEAFKRLRPFQRVTLILINVVYIYVSLLCSPFFLCFFLMETIRKSILHFKDHGYPRKSMRKVKQVWRKSLKKNISRKHDVGSTSYSMKTKECLSPPPKESSDKGKSILNPLFPWKLHRPKSRAQKNHDKQKSTVLEFTDKVASRPKSRSKEEELLESDIASVNPLPLYELSLDSIWSSIQDQMNKEQRSMTEGDVGRRILRKLSAGSVRHNHSQHSKNDNEDQIHLRNTIKDSDRPQTETEARVFGRSIRNISHDA